jgi:hypothetical protein
MEVNKMKEYKQFLAIWDCIHIMNCNGIFTYGRAEMNDGGPVILFDTPDQADRYHVVFGR